MTSPRKEVRPSILKCLVTVFLHINYVPSQCYFRSSFLNSLLHSFNIFPHIFIPSTTILIFSLLNVINPSSTILFIFPPPPHFYCFPSSSSFLLFSLHHHHHHQRHISIVFSPPPPPPHFFCFSSSSPSTSSSFLLFSLQVWPFRHDFGLFGLSRENNRNEEEVEEGAEEEKGEEEGENR